MPSYVGHDSGTATAATSLNLSGVTVIGSNRVLYATLAGFVGTSPTASWNSVSMGTPIYDAAPAPAFLPIRIWRLLAPDTGTNTLAFSWTGSDDMVGGGFAFSDVSQSTPNDAADVATGGDTSAVANAVTSEVGDLVFDFTFAVGGPASATTANTERIDILQSTALILLLGSHAAGAATVNMDWTLNTIGNYTSVAFNLNAGGGAETITVDKWLGLTSQPVCPARRAIASGFIGIKPR